jgi:exopolysaccharide biosynthesis predicted pyruvyltransferase EpsI
MSQDPLLEGLRQRTLNTLRDVITPGPVALLDFPDYANPGDSAIWLGALEALRATGAYATYTSDLRSFDESTLRRVLPSGTILLSGGGNFGDLWPRHQAFRERVVRAFPDHRIVQLPQSLHFQSGDALAAAQRALSMHASFTVLVRDSGSLAMAQRLGCRAVLCPDLAFCLTGDVAPALRDSRLPPRQDVLWLMRTDHESATESRRDVAGVVDWTEAPLSRLENTAVRLRERLATRPGGIMARAQRSLLSAMYPALARSRLLRGCRLIGSTRVLVTDRLHGHILSLLLGVRHVLIGDRHDKVRHFVEQWSAASPLLHWARDVHDAAEVARRLLDGSAAAGAASA